jgi:hypothetical protein
LHPGLKIKRINNAQNELIKGIFLDLKGNFFGRPAVFFITVCFFSKVVNILFDLNGE